MIQKGDKIPMFSLLDQNGSMISTTDMLGKKNMVLFFYPKDESIGCTREVCSFRNNYTDFKEHNAEVIGISADDTASHLRFAGKHRLPYTLLSDPEKRVHRLFGIKDPLSGVLAGRVTFVIDKQGVVQNVFNSIVMIDRHVSESLKALQKLPV